MRSDEAWRFYEEDEDPAEVFARFDAAGGSPRQERGMRMKYYLIWVTRNGGKMWEGPFNSIEAANSAAKYLMFCTGIRVVRDR